MCLVFRMISASSVCRRNGAFSWLIWPNKDVYHAPLTRAESERHHRVVHTLFSLSELHVSESGLASKSGVKVVLAVRLRWGGMTWQQMTPYFACFRAFLPMRNGDYCAFHAIQCISRKAFYQFHRGNNVQHSHRSLRLGEFHDELEQLLNRFGSGENCFSSLWNGAHLPELAVFDNRISPSLSKSLLARLQGVQL